MNNTQQNLNDNWQPEWLASKQLAKKCAQRNTSFDEEYLCKLILEESDQKKKIGWLNLLVQLSTLTQDKQNQNNRQSDDLFSYLIRRCEKGSLPLSAPAYDSASLYTQTLIMHYCSHLLQQYDKDECCVDLHCKLNLTLVPLLKVIFDRPDIAWVVYQRYYDGDHMNPVAPLYREIETILQLQAKSSKDRETLLAELKKDENQREDGLANSIKKTLGDIVHTQKDAKVQSPEHKLSRLAQLTCLIRQRDDVSGNDKSKRQYGAYLDGVDYRRIEIIEGHPQPLYLDWPEQDKTKLQQFGKALRLNYSEGHDSGFLNRFFSNSSSGAIWVQDGEITFFWMLAAINKFKQCSNEYSAELSSNDICGKDDKDIRLPIGDLVVFFTKHCILFRENGKKPTPKFWALVNFLNRLTITRCPEYYKDHNYVIDEAQNLLAALKNCETDNLLNRIKDWANEIDVVKMDNIVKSARLPTFLLEALLRFGDPYPYTLFFLPLSFDSYGGRSMPSVFLGGTFGGLEWDTFPSVTIRQNLHLYAIIDSIRPAIDEEIGRVMREDRDAYIEKLDTDKLFKTIQPHLKQLSDLIGKAQNKIELIDSNLDTDWAGLLSPEANPVIYNLFITNHRVEFKGVNGEIQIIEGQHSSSGWNNEFVSKVFHYFLREVIGDSKTVWPSDKENLFREYPLLNSLWQYFRSENDGSNVMLLLKMLTVEASQTDRGVYRAQIHAALGRTMREEQKKNDLLSTSPKNAVKELARYASIQQRYALLPGKKPSAFLKSLRNLIIALPKMHGDAKSVGVTSISVDDIKDDKSNGLRIVLNCAGAFDKKFQRLLFEHMSSDVQEFHDLRSSVRSIAQTVGYPVFTNDKVATNDEPFVISTSTASNTTTISVYLPKIGDSRTCCSDQKSESIPRDIIRFIEISKNSGGLSESGERLQKWTELGIDSWAPAKEQGTGLMIFAHANDLFSKKVMGEDLAKLTWKSIFVALKQPRRLVLYSGGKVLNQSGENRNILQKLVSSKPDWVVLEDFVSDPFKVEEMIKKQIGQRILSSYELITKFGTIINADIVTDDAFATAKELYDAIIENVPEKQDRELLVRLITDFKQKHQNTTYSKMAEYFD